MKKILLTFAVILAMAVLGAKAQDTVFPYTYQGQTLYYIIDSTDNAMLVPPTYPVASGDTAAWAGYTRPTGAVIVPDSVPYLGTMHAVTAVGDYAFCKCSGLTSVVLPATVSSIGSYAFYLCSAMQSVNIPYGVNRIQNHCFVGCSAIQSFDIPASVSVIEPFGFLGCLSMQTLTLHQGLDTIGIRAFCRCLALEYVTLPEGLRCIDNQAFELDTNLRRIDLPLSLEMIGGDAFHGDTHLDSIIFPDGLIHLYSGVLRDCSGLTYVHLPENLEEVYPLLLYGTGLETFIVPSHVQVIGYMAFAQCPRLHKVTLPASVTNLAWDLFDNSPLDTLVLECAVPPTLGEYQGHTTFREYTATLIVPCGSAEAYRADSVWGRFQNIVESSCTGIEELDASDGIRIYAEGGRIVVEGAADETVLIYDVAGRSVRNEALPTGIYLVKVGNRPAKKLTLF